MPLAAAIVLGFGAPGAPGGRILLDIATRRFQAVSHVPLLRISLGWTASRVPLRTRSQTRVQSKRSLRKRSSLETTAALPLRLKAIKQIQDSKIPIARLKKYETTHFAGLRQAKHSKTLSTIPIQRKAAVSGGGTIVLRQKAARRVRGRAALSRVSGSQGSSGLGLKRRKKAAAQGGAEVEDDISLIATALDEEEE